MANRVDLPLDLKGFSPPGLPLRCFPHRICLKRSVSSDVSHPQEPRGPLRGRVSGRDPTLFRNFSSLVSPHDPLGRLVWGVWWGWWGLGLPSSPRRSHFLFVLYVRRDAWFRPPLPFLQPHFPEALVSYVNRVLAALPQVSLLIPPFPLFSGRHSPSPRSKIVSVVGFYFPWSPFGCPFVSFDQFPTSHSFPAPSTSVGLRSVKRGCGHPSGFVLVHCPPSGQWGPLLSPSCGLAPNRPLPAFLFAPFVLRPHQKKAFPQVGLWEFHSRSEVFPIFRIFFFASFLFPFATSRFLFRVFHVSRPPRPLERSGALTWIVCTSAASSRSAGPLLSCAPQHVSLELIAFPLVFIRQPSHCDSGPSWSGCTVSPSPPFSFFLFSLPPRHFYP